MINIVSSLFGDGSTYTDNAATTSANSCSRRSRRSKGHEPQSICLDVNGEMLYGGEDEYDYDYEDDGDSSYTAEESDDSCHSVDGGGVGVLGPEDDMYGASSLLSMMGLSEEKQHGDQGRKGRGRRRGRHGHNRSGSHKTKGAVPMPLPALLTLPSKHDVDFDGGSGKGNGGLMISKQQHELQQTSSSLAMYAYLLPRQSSDAASTHKNQQKAWTPTTYHGVMNCPFTGDLYEGQLIPGGPARHSMRHGDGAVCRMLDGSKFLGTYVWDFPIHGTLVTSSFSYTGGFVYRGGNISPETEVEARKGTTTERFRYHGYGALVRCDGVRYEGEFRHGRYHGVGKESLSRGDDKSASCFGVMSFSQQGEDALSWTTTYTGNFRGGRRHGVGTLMVQRTVVVSQTDNLAVLEEELEETYVSDTESDSDEYFWEDEEARRKRREKEGKIRPKMGGGGKRSETVIIYTYSGSWRGGSKEGEGTEVVTPCHGGERGDDDASRETYVGTFLRDKRHGRGTLIAAFPIPDGANAATSNSEENGNGSTMMLRCTGPFRVGSPVDGEGWDIIYPDGARYVGDAVGCAPHGKGTMYYAVESDYLTESQGEADYQDDFTSNEEEDNQAAKEAIILYNGEFRHGKRHGRGTCLRASGEEFDGLWMNDEPFMIQKQSTTTVSSTGSVSELRKQYEEHKRLQRQLQTDDGSCTSSAEGSHNNMQNNNTNGNPNEGEETEDDFLLKAACMSKSIKDHSSNLQALKSSKQKTSTSNALSTLSGLPSSPMLMPQQNLQPQAPSCSTTTSVDGPAYRYSNGDTFSGQIDEEGLRQGLGTYRCAKSGATYDGPWLDDMRHGPSAVLVTSACRYVGDFVRDQRHGDACTLVYHDEGGTSYRGQFRRDKFHGIGTWTDADGTVYEGEWREGRRHGAGEERRPDGTVYRGEFRDGRRHGTGTLLRLKTKCGAAAVSVGDGVDWDGEDAEEVIYSGSWVDDAMDGEGVLYMYPNELSEGTDPKGGAGMGGWTSSSSSSWTSVGAPRHEYRGMFSCGLRSGRGTLKAADGSVTMKGIWLRDKPVDGYWILKYSDDSAFSGYAKTGMGEDDSQRARSGGIPFLPIPNGFGTMKYKNGDLYTGNFTDGSREGRGVGVFSNGDRWDGTWRGDSVDVDGTGVLTLADGTIHQFGEVVDACTEWKLAKVCDP